LYNHQYIPSNAGYPNYDTSTTYETQMRRYHQDTSSQKNIYQHQNMASLPTPSPTPSNVSDTSTQKNIYQHKNMASLPTPSPTPSNVSDASQHSIMDLFEDNHY